MARRKRKQEEDNSPAWLVTFSDLMTLLLTFFVLLISMAVMDERRVRQVLFTVRGSLGIGSTVTAPLADKSNPRNVIPGPFDLPQDEMEPLRDMLWEDPSQDIDLKSNAYVEIISIHSDVLFEPGQATLTPRGEILLSKLAPLLRKLDYPVLLAGHTAPARDEIVNHQVSLDPYEFSPTWQIAFLRIMAVYMLFKDLGIPAENMVVEAFGEYRPRASNDTPEGRAQNRRVDIVLDKRNKLAKDDDLLPDELKAPRDPGKYEQDGFIFDLNIPPQEHRE